MVVHRPERCAYEHAQQLVAWARHIDQQLGVDVNDALVLQLQTM